MGALKLVVAPVLALVMSGFSLKFHSARLAGGWASKAFDIDLA